MHKLVIAEKPSVAQSLAKVLGASTRQDGYLEGNGFLVSWCFGHLAGLADASVYDERYAKWRMLTDLVKNYRPVSGADILFPSTEKTVGKCPRCGRPVIERSKGYFCTGQDCKFVLWRDSRFFTLKQKALDRKTAQLLLEKGRAPLKGCVSSKTGKVYDAAVVLEDDGERAHFKLVFGNG